MQDDELLRLLEQARDGYAESCVWEKFLLDAYSSEGGFRGRVRPPQWSFWGPSADLYGSPTSGVRSTSHPETYLDQFPVEDSVKFRRRQDVAHHLNYVAPLTDLKLSHIERKEMREALPEPLLAWRNDLDGNGATLDELRGLIGLRMATVGWCPVLVDLPEAPVDETGATAEISEAQAVEAGIEARPRVIPLWPANLLQWRADDDGAFVWAKVWTCRVEQASWDAEPVEVAEYRIWTRSTVTTYRVTRRKGAAPAIKRGTPQTHPFGRVPIAIFKAKERPQDPITGLPWHADVAVENRRLFNLLSELDEHLRSCVFGMLQAPVDNEEQLRLIQGGNGAVLPVPTTSTRDYLWVTPPTGVADTYERRIEATIREIYRLARVELAKATAQTVSGVARAYEFEQTNAALRSFAKQMARGLEWLYAIVAPALRVTEAQARTIRVTPPPSFDLSDLATDIKNALDALTAKLGATANATIRKRLVTQVLPNLAPAERETIEAEIDQASADEANAAAAVGLLADASSAAQDEDVLNDRDQEFEDEQERAA